MSIKFKVEIEWLLYKWFGIKRKIPCGRKKGENYLCCRQPFVTERSYLTNDNKEWRCKVCNCRRIVSNYKLPDRIEDALNFD